MKLKNILGTSVALVAGLILASCNSAKKESVWESTDKVKVTATTTMIVDMIKVIGGDKVEVKGLMDHSVDPHDHEQTFDDSVAINTADLVFYNGLHLEAKMEEGLESKAKKGDKVFAVSSVIPEASILNDGDEVDPHVWGDPKMWILTVDVVLNALVEQDAANKDYYTERANAYKAELKELDAWAQKRVNEIPESQRVLITSHDAFRYFAKSYGFTVRGLQGISSADAAGVNAAKQLSDYIKQNNIKTIFAESTTNAKGITAVAQEAGAKVNDVELYADACGPLGTIHEAHGEKYDVSTYTGMIKHNINTVVDALK